MILAVLATSGFVRSLQFTSIGALAYAEVEPERISAATSITSVAQPVSQSVGVSIGAMVLEASLAWRGGDVLQTGDFTPAFLIVGLLTATTLFWFRSLPRNAGSELSGHDGAPTGANVPGALTGAGVTPAAAEAALTVREHEPDFGVSGAVTYVFTGSFVAESFADFVRHRAAILDITARIRVNTPTMMSVDAAGQPDLLDAFEMACSLGPGDAMVREVVARRAEQG